MYAFQLTGILTILEFAVIACIHGKFFYLKKVLYENIEVAILEFAVIHLQTAGFVMSEKFGFKSIF